MALKKYYKNLSWYEWNLDIKLRKPQALESCRISLAQDIAYAKFKQYIFFKQWQDLHAYANEKVYK